MGDSNDIVRDTITTSDKLDKIIKSINDMKSTQNKLS